MSVGLTRVRRVRGVPAIPIGNDRYTMSDFGAVEMLGPASHAVAANDSECVRMYIAAGGSVNGHDFSDNYEKLVAELIQTGGLTMNQLDVAVGNVLRVKARLGLIPIKGFAFEPSIPEDLVGERDGMLLAVVRATAVTVTAVQSSPPVCRSCCSTYLLLLETVRNASNRGEALTTACTLLGGDESRRQPGPRSGCTQSIARERGPPIKLGVSWQGSAPAQACSDQESVGSRTQRRRGTSGRLLGRWVRRVGSLATVYASTRTFIKDVLTISMSSCGM
jgi:hypothetical protein